MHNLLTEHGIDRRHHEIIVSKLYIVIKNAHKLTIIFHEQPVCDKLGEEHASCFHALSGSEHLLEEPKSDFILFFFYPQIIAINVISHSH